MRFGDYADPVTTLAEDIVNSYSHSQGRDLLDEEVLTALARARGWTGPEATADDVEVVRNLRHRLREVFEATTEDDAVQGANDLLDQADVVPHLVRDDHGPLHLHISAHRHGKPVSLAPWIAGTSAMALLAVLERDGTARLHRCAGPNCHAVFVDTSRNSSRRYCSPALCGNRVHAAAHRARQSGRRPPDNNAATAQEAIFPAGGA